MKDELKTLRAARSDLNLVVAQDQSLFVQESFNDAMRELLIGALMASLVVFIFFRNLRNTLVTVAGLPIILLGAFAAMSALNMTINIVSLMAMTLSVGLIIDDAIVVRENVFRHMEMGKTPKEAAAQGTAEVALPVVAMSLTIVSVFLPIAFVGGLIGKFLNSFGLVVSIAVLISLVEALTFAPMLSAYLFKQQKPKIAPAAQSDAATAHVGLGRYRVARLPGHAGLDPAPSAGHPGGRHRDPCSQRLWRHIPQAELYAFRRSRQRRRLSVDAAWNRPLRHRPKGPRGRSPAPGPPGCQIRSDQRRRNRHAGGCQLRREPQGRPRGAGVRGDGRVRSSPTFPA